MSVRAYPAYKDSGVERIGELPSGWELGPLKRYLKAPLMYGANQTADDITPGNPRFVRITDISPDGTLHDDTFRSLPHEVAAPFLLSEGDLLLARSGATVGKSFRYRASWGTACFAGYLIRARFKIDMMLPVFADYFCSSKHYWAFIDSEQIQATIPNVSAERYSAMLVPRPPIAEQRTIAAFLDRETGKIDALVAEQERLMALLKEKRQAVISQAVTKGLNLSAKMKPSGVEWLGEVPAHWRVARLKDAGHLQGGAGFPHDEQGVEGLELPFYKVANLGLSEDGIVIGSSEHSVSRATALRLGAKIIPPDAVLYAKIGAALLLNRRRIAGSLCCIDNNMTAFVPDSRQLTVKWAWYWLSIIDFGRLANPGAVPSFSEGDQSITPILLPPPEDQDAIVTHLDAQLGSVDALTLGATRAITLLKERRAALISAAVTGKIDVRDMADIQRDAA